MLRRTSTQFICHLSNDYFTIKLIAVFFAEPSQIFARCKHVQSHVKSEETPLLNQLRSKIRINGPLTVAQYMQECLTNPTAVLPLFSENYISCLAE